MQFRLHEFDPAVACVREGMSRVVPVPLLSLFTGYELETMVCGSPDIPLHLLKSVATYKGEDCKFNFYVFIKCTMECYATARPLLKDHTIF